MRILMFSGYKIIIYENEEELKNSQLEGCRSLCPNSLKKPVAIELIGEGCEKKECEWAFCHLINLLLHSDYKTIVQEV